MKKFIFLILLHVFTAGALMAQQPVEKTAGKPVKGYRHAAGVALYLPVGTFSESHVVGVGADYTWSHYRHGNNLSYKRAIRFIASGGLNFFTGKKIRTAGYDFRYANLVTVYVMPGIIYNPFTKGSVSLTGGPVLNFYKGSGNTSLGVTLQTNYSLSKNISVGPGLIYRKRTHTDALWAGGLRASYAF